MVITKKTLKSVATAGSMAVIVVGLGTACSESLEQIRDGRSDVVLAKVGDHEITRAELERELAQLPPYVQGRVATPEGRREFLDNLLTRRALMLEAERMGLHEDPQITRQIADYRERLILQRLMADKLPERTELSEDDLRAYYQDNVAEYQVDEQVRLRQILIHTDSRSLEEARRLAQSLLEKVRAGADFETMAREHSDAPSARRGGDTGFLSRDRLSPTVADTAFELAPGQVSSLIEDDKGVSIVQVIERREAQEKNFEDVREQIRRRLAPQRERETYQTFVADLRDQHAIRINEAALAEVKAPNPAGEKGPEQNVPSEQPQY